MNFISYSDLIADVDSLAKKLPEDIVGVVGIPRSGMLPASLLAMRLGVNLGEVDSFIWSGGAFFRPGRRMSWDSGRGSLVVVDDSVHAGASMDFARRAIQANPSIRQFYTGVHFVAVYITPGAENKVHYWSRPVESPRVFQWNLWTSDHLTSTSCDLDGVLCEDPPPFEVEDKQYEEAIAGVKPLYLPRRRLASIITGRIERWREATEEWLSLYGITYESLQMSPFASEKERRAFGVENWKSEVYRGSSATLLIESSSEQADVIASQSKKPVLCVEDWRLR